MATPPDSTTIFNGRRCTRSRIAPPASSVVTFAAEEAAQTIAAAAASVETAIASPPPQAPAPAQTTTPNAIPATSIAAPPPAAAAPTSAANPNTPAPAPSPTTAPPIDGNSPVSSQTTAPSSRTQALVVSPPAAAVGQNGIEPTEPALDASSEGSSSRATPTAVAAEDAPTTTNGSATPTPITTSSLSDLSNIVPGTPSSPSSPLTPMTGDSSRQTDSPMGGPAGMISPEKGSGGPGGAALDDGRQMNIGGIVGSVMGGFVGIALLGALLFVCLRRRKPKDPFASWQRLNEKDDSKSRPWTDKIKSMVAGVKVGGLFAKLRGKKEDQEALRRQSVRSSVSSVYTTRPNQRIRSMSEPPWRIKEQLRGFGDRMPSLKRSRTLLGKRKDSLVTSSKSPFAGFVEDPLVRNSKGEDNPFADPVPEIPPSMAPNYTSSQRAISEGLLNQQRAPISQPTPVATDRRSDPFASILDEIDGYNRAGTPDWLRDSSHKRTQSFGNALRSHPPSSVYTNSVYTNAPMDPFADPDIPPVPSQPLPPNPIRRPSNAYASLAGPYAQDRGNARRSDTSLFGEPGPSQRTTMFSVANAPRPKGRDSDPFDLDRPEVLGFGNVLGRKEVRASVTRQNSKSNRTSSVPNFGTSDEWSEKRTDARRQ